MSLWFSLALHRIAARAIAGICAAGVGMLAVAPYDPLWASAVHAPGEVLVAALGFLVLTCWPTFALLVVFMCVALSAGFGLL